MQRLDSGKRIISRCYRYASLNPKTRKLDDTYVLLYIETDGVVALGEWRGTPSVCTRKATYYMILYQLTLERFLPSELPLAQYLESNDGKDAAAVRTAAPSRWVRSVEFTCCHASSLLSIFQSTVQSICQPLSHTS